MVQNRRLSKERDRWTMVILPMAFTPASQPSVTLSIPFPSHTPPTDPPLRGDASAEKCPADAHAMFRTTCQASPCRCGPSHPVRRRGVVDPAPNTVGNPRGVVVVLLLDAGTMRLCCHATPRLPTPRLRPAKAKASTETDLDSPFFRTGHAPGQRVSIYPRPAAAVPASQPSRG